MLPPIAIPFAVMGGPTTGRRVLGSISLLLALSLFACTAPVAPTSPVQAAQAPPVPPSAALGQAVLGITSFSVVEYQYKPSDTAQWFYAPLVRVAETGGGGGATITEMSFNISSLPAAPPFRSSKCVGAGEQRDLLNEAYGDYELSIDHFGYRALPGQASALLSFTDSTGRTGTLTATGPIVPGGLPTTYTGGLSWTCRPGGTVGPLDFARPGTSR